MTKQNFGGHAEDYYMAWDGVKDGVLLATLVSMHLCSALKWHNTSAQV